MHRQILYASALADAWCWFGGRPRATPALFRAFPERKVALTATDAQLTAAQSKAAARAKKKKKTALFPRGPVQNSRSGAGMDGDVSENLEGDDARKRGDAGGLEPIQLLGRLFRSLILVFTSQDAAVVGVVAWWPRPAACPRETRRRPCLRAARALNLLVYLLHCSSRHGAWRQEMNCSCRSAVCCRCEHEYGWILSAE
jgi:hypothetical protein